MIIKTRKLTDHEIDILIKEMKNFPDVGLYDKNQWKSFPSYFIGVCVVIPLKEWIKIGPVIILKAYQGKGYGKKMLKFVANIYKNKNIYIGSSNIWVCNMMENLRFQCVNSFFRLPGEIQIYLIKHFFMRINWEYLLDAIPKIFNKSGNYKYFIRFSKV